MELLDRFFLLRDVPASQLLASDHDVLLVLVSVGVAILTSALAFHLAAQARAAQEPLHRSVALASGGVALGGGVWAMHFIGMLAFELCTEVSYDVPITLVSLLPAQAASWVALGLLAHDRIGPPQLLTGGVLMGAGIGLMHYGGMAAMRLAPMLRYDPLWFALSIGVAVMLSVLALWVRFPLQQRTRMTAWQANLVGGAVMGCAIAGMHYTAMAATRFIGEVESVADQQLWEQHLAIVIASVTLGVAAFIGIGNGLLRYRDLFLQVQRNESRLRTLVDTAVDGIITIDPHGIIQSFNHSAERIFGWQANEVLGRNVSMLMPEPHRSAHNGYLRHHMETGGTGIIGVGREVTGVRKDGTELPLRLGIGRADGGSGGPLFVGFVSDLSAAKHAQTQLSIAASVFEYSYEAVLILNAEHAIVDMNPAFERMTGISRALGLGRYVHELFSDVGDRYGKTPVSDSDTIWRAVQATGHWQGELRGLGASGGQVQRVSIAAVSDADGADRHFVAVISDISDIKAYEEELERFALYDSLTGLPNRRLLNDRMHKCIEHADRSNSLLAVCYLDLDGFKQVNDQFGHEGGDQLLIEVGRRIQQNLRSEDTLARLGGDEMAILLGDLPRADDYLPVMLRIMSAINEPVPIPGGYGHVSASVGVSLYPVDGSEPGLLLRRADHAMYASKQAGKNRCTRFAQLGGTFAPDPGGIDPDRPSETTGARQPD